MYRHAGRNPLAAAGSRRCHLAAFFCGWRCPGLLAQMAGHSCWKFAYWPESIEASCHPAIALCYDPGQAGMLEYRAASHIVAVGRGYRENPREGRRPGWISVITNASIWVVFPSPADPRFLHLGLEVSLSARTWHHRNGPCLQWRSRRPSSQARRP